MIYILKIIFIISATGYRLKRGYKNKASVLERPPDITHVVFVIHGIGQKMDSGRIIRNTNASVLIYLLFITIHITFLHILYLKINVKS